MPVLAISSVSNALNCDKSNDSISTCFIVPSWHQFCIAFCDNSQNILVFFLNDIFDMHSYYVVCGWYLA